MKVLNIIKKLLPATAAIFAMTACDDVDTADRYIEIDASVATGDIPRWVLLEDFTGQNCVNCPWAHLIIKQNSQLYGECLVPVAIHGGEQAIMEGSSPNFVGLANAESNEIFRQSGANALPQGIINRNSGLLGRADWSAYIRTCIAEPTPLNMTISSVLNADNTISVTVEGAVAENVSGNLLVWLTESKIVAFQQTPNSDDWDGTKRFDLDYVHDHVFRAYFNGLNGTPVTWTTDKGGKETFTLPVAANWNTDNLSVVAFVQDKKGVVQAIQAHLGNRVSNTDAKGDNPAEE